MRKTLRLFALLAAAFAVRIKSSRDVFMSLYGSDSNEGTIGSPVATLQECASKAGDHGTCFIRSGRYHVADAVVLSGYQDLTIKAWPEDTHPVILDGTHRLVDGVADPSLCGRVLHGAMRGGARVERRV